MLPALTVPAWHREMPPVAFPGCCAAKPTSTFLAVTAQQDCTPCWGSSCLMKAAKLHLCCFWLQKCPFWCCLCCAPSYPAEMPQSSCLQYLEREGRGKEGFWCSDCSISMNLQPSMESVTIYWPVLHTEIQIPAKQHFSDLGKHPLSLIWNSAQLRKQHGINLGFS